MGIWLGYQLAQAGPWKSWAEAALALPLVLPPTVLGYYFIVAFAGKSLFGEPLVFSFTGLLIASIIINLPFAIQPIQRAYEAIPAEIKEAAKVSGLSTWQRFRLIELPLAWRGILSGAAMTLPIPWVRLEWSLWWGAQFLGKPKPHPLQSTIRCKHSIAQGPAPSR